MKTILRAKNLLAVLLATVAAAAALVMLPAAALADGTEITHAPQSYQWRVGDMAEYFCEADDPAGLFTYDWHIIYGGKDYRYFDLDGSTPFEKADPANMWGADGNRFYFAGISSVMDGAQIYCNVTRSSGTTPSPVATIMVTQGKVFEAPEMVAPVLVHGTVGQPVSLTVKATSRVSEGKGWLTYEWMTCGVSDLFSAQLIGAKSGDLETEPTYTFTPSEPGVFYFVCRVTEGPGGAGATNENVSYTNIIEVVVEAATGGASGTESGSGSGNGGTVTVKPAGSGSGSGSGTTTVSPSGSGTGTGDPAPAPAPAPAKDGGLPVWAIILIAAMAVAIIVLVVIMVLMKRQSKAPAKGAHSPKH